MRWRGGVLAAVVCIAVLMLTFGIPTAAARGTGGHTTAGWANHTIVVLPNGQNDTADIQAAFNACASYGPGCTVQLVKGTYYTEQIAVYGFQGSFVGAGQGRTFIQALPNLPDPNSTYNTATVPFWAGNPTGAAGSNPWPDLFTFVGGTFSISRMTINEPYANPITSPGWFSLYSSYVGYTTALAAVILVTGDEAASAAITHVTINGAGGDLTIPLGTPSTFNLDSSIVYEGMFLPAGWSDPFVDQIPVSGTFSLTDSVIYWSESAFYFENLLDATVVVSSNSISSTPAPEYVDVSNSQLYFVGNSFTNIMYGGAIIGSNSYYKTNLLPSTVYVVGNYIAANWQGSGIVLLDYGPSEGIPATLNAVVTGNTIVSDNSCECYTEAVSDVIIDDYLVSGVLSGNTVIGGGGGVFVYNTSAVVRGNVILGAYDGVYLWNVTNTPVTGNVVKASVQYGIALTNESSYNLVAHNLVKGSGVYDLYWDGTGTDNTWVHNLCQTSSPAGLC